MIKVLILSRYIYYLRFFNRAYGNMSAPIRLDYDMSLFSSVLFTNLDFDESSCQYFHVHPITGLRIFPFFVHHNGKKERYGQFRDRIVNCLTRSNRASYFKLIADKVIFIDGQEYKFKDVCKYENNPSSITEFRDGTLLSCAKSIYYIENGLKRLFPDSQHFMSYGYEWSAITYTDCPTLDSYPSGSDMTFSYENPTPVVDSAIAWGNPNISTICFVDWADNTCRGRNNEVTKVASSLVYPDVVTDELDSKSFPFVELDYFKSEGWCHSNSVDLRQFKRIVDLTCLSNRRSSYFHEIMDCIIPNTHLYMLSREWNSPDTAAIIPEWPIATTQFTRNMFHFLIPNASISLFAQDLFDRPNCCCYLVKSGVKIAYPRVDVPPMDFYRIDIWDYNNKNLSKLVRPARSIQSAKYFRDLIFSALNRSDLISNSNSSGPKKKFLYLKRVQSRYISNFLDVLPGILPPDYELVPFFGTENIHETITKFYDADIVIGFHGAGLANIIFCRNSTVVIEISLTTNLQEFTMIKNTSIWRTNRMVGLVHGAIHWILFLIHPSLEQAAFRKQIMVNHAESVDKYQNIRYITLSEEDAKVINLALISVLHFTNMSSYTELEAPGNTSSISF